MLGEKFEEMTYSKCCYLPLVIIYYPLFVNVICLLLSSLRVLPTFLDVKSF